MAERCTVDITLYRAVLFDMDGVVADTMPLHFEAWKEAFSLYGIVVTRQDVYLREGLPTPMMAREIAAGKKAGLNDADLLAITKLKSEIFDRRAGSRVRAFDGVKETLNMLRGNRIKTALVTGSRTTSALEVLRATGLEGLFDVIVTGDDTEKGKPTPDPYLKAIERLGVNRLNCVVVENAPLGIKAAKAAGVDYVLAVATSVDESCLGEADDVMQSITELEQCLARRFASRRGKVAI